MVKNLDFSRFRVYFSPAKFEYIMLWTRNEQRKPIMITPYLTFGGSCKDALDFYRAVFHCGEPKVMLYGDYMPEGSKTPPELLRDWIMHGEMVICGTNVWFADEAAPPKIGDGIKLSAAVPTGKEAAAIFDALRVGGETTLPPTETFYSVFHAAVTDKFGVNWNVVAEEAPQKQETRVPEFTLEELSEVHRSLLSMLSKCEKVLESEKLPQSQRTLTERRVAALKLALTLIEKEL
jgi:PhnB protein